MRQYQETEETERLDFARKAAKRRQNHDPIYKIRRRKGNIMTHKHTPGPWRVSHKTKALTVDSSFGCRVAQCSKNDSFTKYQLSNARLIAAAPELLEALELLYGVIEDTGLYKNWATDPKAVRVQQLIAKARGES